MFNQDIQRIGFACKYMHSDQTLPKKVLEEIQRPLNTKATTVQWLNKQSREVAEQRLWDIMEHNIRSYYNLIKYVGELPVENRMVRLGSDALPVFTHSDWSYFWKTSDVLAYCETAFADIGTLSKNNNVRLSFHPGQFTVLASDNSEIVDRSIDEFEYHVNMARWMGYGKEFQDFKINVHISGRRGPQGIREALSRMSPEARNTLTIENDENKWGIDSSIELAKDCALVLDIHHHWCREGEYIQPTDDRFKRIVDSWRGVRPVIHYSYSRDSALPEGFDHSELPNMPQLLALGYKKAKLRAHSDWYPNAKANEWALSFNEHADIMCESKCKNLASQQLSNQRALPGYQPGKLVVSASQTLDPLFGGYRPGELVVFSAGKGVGKSFY